VGTVESARGITGLLVAIPVGWAGDRWPKTWVMKKALISGCISVGLLVLGFPFDFLPFVVAGCVLGAVQSQTGFSLLPPLFAEMVAPGQPRTIVMSNMQTTASLASATAPLLQIMLIWLTQAKRWKASELHWVLLGGVVLFFIYAFLLVRALSMVSDGSTPSEEQDSASEDPEATPAFDWFVATMLELTSLITSIGSGMTFKYWPLFFMIDFQFSPVGVCLMQFLIWLCIAGSAQLSPVLAKYVGRLPTCLMLHILGTSLLFVISSASNGVFVEVPLVLLRNAVMNASGPLSTSLILDLVPKRHRGKWSSVNSLRRVSWSGSAFLGGLLSDSHDFRFAFFVTACVHSVSGIVLLVVTLAWWWKHRSHSTPDAVNSSFVVVTSSFSGMGLRSFRA